MTFFSNKVIWITGASSGIGEELIYQLAKKGARLIISARRKEELERVKGNCIKQSHPNIRILPLDLGLATLLELNTQAAIQIFGHIDILINNGGISQRSLAMETSLDVDRRIMEIDYFGTISLTKYLLPHFINRKSGHFVTVSSVMGMYGTPYRSGYAAAKHALHGFFDSLRAEVYNNKISVTLVCPGWIQTNITLHALTGNGSELNKMDDATSKGLKPKAFVSKMIKAIRRKKKEVYIGGTKEVAGVYLKRWFPRLFASMVRKVKVR